MNDQAALDNFSDLRRSARLTASATFVSVVVVLASLAYSTYQMHSLDQKLTSQREQSKNLDDEIKAKQSAVNTLDHKVNELNLVVSLIPSNQLQQAIAASPTAASQLPARVYIHIAREDQRPSAQKAATVLRATGCIVPGIENVGEKAPKASQVRYFLRSDEQGKDLPVILQALIGAGIQTSGQFVPMKLSTAVRPRHFELWFGTEG